LEREEQDPDILGLGCRPVSRKPQLPNQARVNLGLVPLPSPHP